MIALDEPMQFEEALKVLSDKGILPTSWGTADIRYEISKELRRRAIFSARTTKEEILEEIKAKAAAMVRGTTNLATGRAEVQDLYDALSYTPEGGFPDDEPGFVPPADRGSLQDLSSSRRVDLVLVTNMRQVANYGFWQQGQSEFGLWAWPCA